MLIPGIHIVWIDQVKKGLEQCWSCEPTILLIKQKGLWPVSQVVKPYKCGWRDVDGHLTNFRNEHPAGPCPGRGDASVKFSI